MKSGSTDQLERRRLSIPGLAMRAQRVCTRHEDINGAEGGYSPLRLPLSN